jgi:hypothetical protein
MPERLIRVLCCFLLSLLCSGCRTAKVRTSSEQVYSHYIRRSNADTVIVFVHGIFGDAKSTWTNSDSRAYWPELITTDSAFDGADVYVTRWPTCGTPQLRGAAAFFSRVCFGHDSSVALGNSAGPSPDREAGISPIADFQNLWTAPVKRVVPHGAQQPQTSQIGEGTSSSCLALSDLFPVITDSAERNPTWASAMGFWPVRTQLMKARQAVVVGSSVTGMSRRLPAPRYGISPAGRYEAPAVMALPFAPGFDGSWTARFGS